MVEDSAFSLKIDNVTLFLGSYKSQKESKSHYWFKSYGTFAEWVDFANWWSFSGGGSAISGATPSSLKSNIQKIFFYIGLSANKAPKSF